MSDLISDLRTEFRRHKNLADRAMAQVDEGAFFRRPGEQVNSIAIVVKHLAGNLLSRWSDFQTSDGEKPTRDRDSEFVINSTDTRASLLAKWEAGWRILFESIERLSAAELDNAVTIRGEPHTVQQALLRGLTHTAYHVGQITYLARLGNPDGAWLTIAPGQSGSHKATYLKR